MGFKRVDSDEDLQGSSKRLETSNVGAPPPELLGETVVFTSTNLEPLPQVQEPQPPPSVRRSPHVLDLKPVPRSSGFSTLTAVQVIIRDDVDLPSVLTLPISLMAEGTTSVGTTSGRKM